MLIHQIRNATMIVSLGEHRLLIDPMLSDPGAMPGFKMVGGGRRRNPLVALPAGTSAALEAVTAVVITHEHPDHLDRPGVEWIKQRALPVWANGVDLPHLRNKGLDVHALRDGALGMGVEIIASRHGKGMLGYLMGPVAGYFLAHPGEPTLYLTGDAVLTESVREAIARLQPDVIVAPAGAANMGMGGDILFSMDELVELVRMSHGEVVLNHLEALDHCPTTRAGLRARMEAEGLHAHVHVPNDGETLAFKHRADSKRPRISQGGEQKPGLQKWITQAFTG